MHTALRGRSARGRAFIGPCGESGVNNGFIGGTAASDMAVAWQTFGTNLFVDGAEHVVASYKNSTALTVTNYSVRNALGTMRLRQSRLAS